MSGFIKSTKEENQIVIIETDGYLNNEGGEAISTICYEKMSEGKNKFLINMAGTKVVNSIGVSILIEIIEKLQEVDGKIGYYNLAPIVSKTFNIMGLTKYSTVFATEEEAVSGL
ncbi:MAG: STAS domain-containing protein [Chitinophagaceae bacterium]|jgi:anti-anti-sigma factor